MNSSFKNLALAGALSLTLAACGGSSDSDSSQTISGTAASGLAFTGNVIAVNAAGEISNSVAINADGSFSVSLPSGGPYLLKAFNDDETLYSFAIDSSAQNTNITQLTTLALLDATDRADLEAIFEQWGELIDSDTVAQNTLDDISEAAAQVVANLQNAGLFESFSSTDFDPNTLNVFTFDFDAAYTLDGEFIAGDEFDSVLDEVSVNYSCSDISDNVEQESLGTLKAAVALVDDGIADERCSVSVSIGEELFSYNYDISVEGFNVGFIIDLDDVIIDGEGVNIPDGDFDVAVTTTGTVTTNGFTVAIPETTVNINDIAKPANQDAFCGGLNGSGTTPQGFTFTECTFDGTTARVVGSADITGNGQNLAYDYVVTYVYS